jgi:hypothetical protein
MLINGSIYIYLYYIYDLDSLFIHKNIYNKLYDTSNKEINNNKN